MPSAAGPLLIHAWPDRVAKNRGASGRFVLANGRGAALDETERLAGEPFLVVADLQGTAREARIASAAAVTEDDLRASLADRITTETTVALDPTSRTIRATGRARLGAITLGETPLPRLGGSDADAAMLSILSEKGLELLRPSDAARSLRERLSWLHRRFGPPWPDVSDEALEASLDVWLGSFLSGETALGAIEGETLHQALQNLVPPDLRRALAQWAPATWEAPTGSRVAIDYAGEEPRVALRVQELFGLGRHPAIAEGRVPLTLDLLSPAHRPIQTTRDLPGFWQGSWRDVRSEMRGRYPRHSWPEDPGSAQPTTRAKPRGT